MDSLCPELHLPLVELIATNPQFTGYLRGRPIPTLQEFHSLALEFGREDLSLSHVGHPGIWLPHLSYSPNPSYLKRTLAGVGNNRERKGAVMIYVGLDVSWKNIVAYAITKRKRKLPRQGDRFKGELPAV